MVRTGNVDFSCKRLTSIEIRKSKYHIRRVRFRWDPPHPHPLRKISGSALAFKIESITKDKFVRDRVENVVGKGYNVSKKAAFLGSLNPETVRLDLIAKRTNSQSSHITNKYSNVASQEGFDYVKVENVFIFQLREYPCNITHDILFLIYNGYF